jgi:hypothetical protein
MVYFDHIRQETFMAAAGYFRGPGPDLLVHGGVLTPSIRRDLTDLNRQFLELGLQPELSQDPRFAWSGPVRSRLLGADASTLGRMASCPFALFGIRLPVPTADGRPAPSRVEDGAAVIASGEPWHGRCLAFVHSALFVALRLADTAPLAARIALGLSPGAELRLNEMCQSEVAQLATCPDVIHPRWPAQPRFWVMLRGAARQSSPASWQWAHCFGICLLGPDLDGFAENAPPASRHPPPR